VTATISWQGINLPLQIMEALRAHIHLSVGENHARVTFGDAFIFLSVVGGRDDIQEGAKEDPFAALRIIAEDDEILAPIGPHAGKADVDATLVIHAHAIPTLLHVYSWRGKLIKGNLRPFNAPVSHYPARRSGNSRGGRDDCNGGRDC
jgi:hypothetical protein